jgi:5'-methylthioadenosine phosphorylase
VLIMGVAVVLGSAFGEPVLGGQPLIPRAIDTAEGPATLHHLPGDDTRWVLFRHGAPHRWLPHQIPYRAQAAALHAVGCTAVLLTSSVGVLSPEVPLFVPLLLRDLLMLDNRLPDGSTCTRFVRPDPEQGHLVLMDGLFSTALSAQVEDLAAAEDLPVAQRVTFAHVGGPRTKSAFENQWLASTGVQVNSMSVGPEVVLLNEYEIAVAAMVVGHKRSGAQASAPASTSAQVSIPAPDAALDAAAIDASLVSARAATERIALAFLGAAPQVPFGNRIHKLGH